MSNTTNTDYGASSDNDNFDFAGLQQKIEEQYEKEEEMMADIKKDEAEIRSLQEDISDRKSWDSDHDHWYDFHFYRNDINDNKHIIRQDRAKIAALTNQVSDFLKKLQDMASNLDLPIYEVELKIQKLFDTLFSGKINQKQLEEVTALMVEIMAIVQVILGLVSNNKTNFENRMSEENIACYKQNIESAKRTLKEIEDAKHAAVVVNIVMKVVEAAVILAIGALTGGAGAMAMAVVMASLTASGGLDKATDSLAHSMGSKIGAEVLMTALTAVATAGVGAAASGVEASISAAMSEAMESVTSSVASSVTDEVATQVASNAASAVGGAGSAAANTAAKQAAEQVIGSSVNSAAQTAAQAASRKLVSEGLVNAIRSLTNGTFEQTVRAAVEESAQAAASAVSNEAEIVAAVAAQNASAPAVITQATEQFTARVADDAANTGANVALRTVLGQQAKKSVIAAASNSAEKNMLSDAVSGAKTGTAFGVMQTNLGVDGTSAAILAFDKKAKDKEWYQILMGIVTVLQALICMIAMGSSMGGSSDSKLTDLKSDSLTKLALYTERFAGATTAVTSLAQMQADLNQADALRDYARQEKDNMLYKHILDLLTQSSNTVVDRYGKLIKEEVDSTQAVIKHLADSQQQVAKTLLESAV